MNRRRMVAFAVFFALLLPVTPLTGGVAAASDELVVGTQYSTESELAGGGLTEMSVSGSGENAEVVANDPVNLSDGFDDGNTNGWTVESSGSFTAVQSPHSGSHAAEFSPDTGQWQNYVNRTQVTTTGNVTISGYVQDHIDSGGSIDDDSPWLSLASNASAQYGVRVSPVNDLVELIKITDTGKTRLDSASASLSLDTYYHMSLTRNQRTGVMEVTVETTDGSTAATLAETDNSFTPTTAGVGTFRNTPTFDEIQITESDVDASYYFSRFDDVSRVDAAAINITAVQDVRNADVEVEYRTDSGGSWQEGNSSSITAAGNQTLELPDVDASSWQMYVVYTSDGPDPELSIGDGSILFTNHKPQGSNASSTGDLQSSDPTFTLDVTDPEFGTAQGDTVTATLHVDGSSVGSDTLHSNGTASVNPGVGLDGGSHSYYWTLEDEYGASTTTQTYDISVPATLQIRNVSDPSQLLTDGDGTVTFFGGTDEQTIIDREIGSDGEIDLSGLPTNTEFTVVVDVPGYYSRQVVIESLYEQSTIHLLNESTEDAVEVTFRLDDKTGKFSGRDAQLLVQRPIERNNETNWATVVGDDIGASSELSAILVNEQRYRIVATNGDERRILGAYTATGADVETLTIGAVSFTSEIDGNTAFQATLQSHDLENETVYAAELAYVDLAGQTSEVTYRITQETPSGTQVIVANTTITQVPTRLVVAKPLPNATAGETYYVDYWIERAGEQSHARIPIGELPERTEDWPIDPNVLELIGYVVLIGFTGLLAMYDAQFATLGCVVGATTLTLLGVVDINPILLSVAGGIAIIHNAAGRHS